MPYLSRDYLDLLFQDDSERDAQSLYHLAQELMKCRHRMRPLMNTHSAAGKHNLLAN
jgi:hypothetical protein